MPEPGPRDGRSQRPVVEDPLVEVVVLPGAGDEQVPRRRTEDLEAAPLEDALAGDVVQERPGPDPARAAGLGMGARVLHRRPGQPPSLVLDVDPVADARAA